MRAPLLHCEGDFSTKEQAAAPHALDRWAIGRRDPRRDAHANSRFRWRSARRDARRRGAGVHRSASARSRAASCLYAPCRDILCPCAPACSVCSLPLPSSSRPQRAREPRRRALLARRRTATVLVEPKAHKPARQTTPAGNLAHAHSQRASRPHKPRRDPTPLPTPTPSAEPELLSATRSPKSSTMGWRAPRGSR